MARAILVNSHDNETYEAETEFKVEAPTMIVPSTHTASMLFQ